MTETPDAVQFETKYGTLSYRRGDIVRLERTTAVSSGTTGSLLQKASLLHLIPAGPINPFAPPQAPSLASYGLAGPPAVSITSGTLPVPR